MTDDEKIEAIKAWTLPDGNPFWAANYSSHISHRAYGKDYLRASSVATNGKLLDYRAQAVLMPDRLRLVSGEEGGGPYATILEMHLTADRDEFLKVVQMYLVLNGVERVQT